MARAPRPLAVAVPVLRKPGRAARAGSPVPAERCPACGRRKRAARPAPRPALVGRGYVGHVERTGGVLLTFEGLVTVNELNDRKTKTRGKRGIGPVQLAVVDAGMRDWLAGRHWFVPDGPFIATLTRVAPSEGLDDDGLGAALKRVRDAVAGALGVDDGPRGPVTWVPRQRRGPWGVAVEIEWEPT